MTRDIGLLRGALLANAAFSTLTGALLLSGHDALVEWIGAVPAWVLTGIGAGLLGFAAWVAWVTRRPTPVRALMISALDLGWVVGTVPLALASDLFTVSGVGTVLVVACAVGGFALAQLAGLRRMMRNPEPRQGLWRHCVRVRVDATADAMWTVVSDLGAIARFSPSLASSVVEGDAPVGTGAVRTCSNTAGQTWSEACEAFEPSRRSYRLRFLAERRGFPFPASVMHGGWRVEPDGDGSIVEVWWSLTPTLRPGWLVVALMGFTVDRDVAAMISRMAEVAKGRPLPDTPPRLASAFC